MGFLDEECTLKVYNEDILKDCNTFDCGDDESSKDLNDFFINDAIAYSKQLLGKSYCFTLDENPKTIICAFTLSNDSINVNLLPNNRKKQINKEIPRGKQFARYPAVLIGRLGVNKQYQGKHNGYLKKVSEELMDFIKSWFLDKENKTGCRFIIVDAYNDKKTLAYYKNNGFNCIFSTEEQEKECTNFPFDKELKTRLMRFDLIILKKDI